MLLEIILPFPDPLENLILLAPNLLDLLEQLFTADSDLGVLVLDASYDLHIQVGDISCEVFSGRR
jgi:hypothetical protein